MGIIGDIANKLTGSSKTGSVSSAASKLFGGNLINSITPINSSGNDYIQFPDDLMSRNDITQYTAFKCADWATQSWSGNKKKTNLGVIYLPLPRDLTSEYKSDWGSEEGGLGATVKSGIQDVINSSNFADGAGAAFGGLGNAGEYKAKKIIHGSVDGFGMGAAYKNLTQEVMNPMNLLNWKSPDFRSFSFSWNLVPSSGKESESLNQIIYWMKRFIHTPSAPNASTLKYPPLWDVNFVDNTGLNPNTNGNKFLFKMKECAITSISVDYNGNGNSYHRMGIDEQGFQAPNGIKLTIGLTETKILTQHDFNTGYSDKPTP